MKKTNLLLSLAILLILSSCGGDDEPSVNPLVGSWQLSGITISNPPNGYSLELINVTPSTTILGELSYDISLLDDQSYSRTIAGATVIDTDGNSAKANLDDDGQWSQSGSTLTLTQENTNVNDLPLSFVVQSTTDTQIVLETEDLWFAWPPEITNDPVALDTVTTNEGFDALFIEYGEIVTVTYAMQFNKN